MNLKAPKKTPLKSRKTASDVSSGLQVGADPFKNSLSHGTHARAILSGVDVTGLRTLFGYQEPVLEEQNLFEPELPGAFVKKLYHF